MRQRSLLRTLALLILLGFGSLPAAAQAVDSFDLVAPQVGGLKKLSMRLSQYSIVFARLGTAVELLGPGERPLGVRLSREDFCEASLQGTVNIEGRLFSVASKGKKSLVNCALPKYSCPRCAAFALGQNRFAEVGAPGAAGDRAYGLVPYRTVAAMQRGLAAGTVLYIPAVRGLRMPDGRRHDGYFFVADTGGLRSTQLDLYAGAVELSWRIIGSGRTGRTTTVYIVTDKIVIAKLKAPHIAAAKAFSAEWPVARPLRASGGITLQEHP